jgi:hypothetical protein
MPTVELVEIKETDCRTWSYYLAEKKRWLSVKRTCMQIE